LFGQFVDIKLHCFGRQIYSTYRVHIASVNFHKILKILLN